MVAGPRSRASSSGGILASGVCEFARLGIFAADDVEVGQVDAQFAFPTQFDQELRRRFDEFQLGAGEPVDRFVTQANVLPVGRPQQFAQVELAQQLAVLVVDDERVGRAAATEFAERDNKLAVVAHREVLGRDVVDEAGAPETPAVKLGD